MLNLQEEMQKMNQSGAEIKLPGSEPAAVEKPVEKVETPAPGSETTTKTPTSAQPLNKDTKPPEPSGIVKKDESTPLPGGAAPSPAGGEPAKPEGGTASTEVVFSETLSALTEGHLKTKDDLVGLINDYNELRAQAAEGFKPKFADERARKAHQILAGATGMEPAAAMRTLRALNFNPEGKTPKDMLFEAYLLDPKNSDLTESRAARLFEEEYNELYGDIEGNDRKQRQLELKVKEAKAMIDQVQNDFKEIEEEPARMSKEVETSIQKVASEFGGIRIAFTDNPTEMDYLNVPVTDQKVLARLHDIALNPPKAHGEFMKQFETKQGFDYPAYFQAVYEREHATELRQQAYDHGYKQGQIALKKELANHSSKKDISSAGTPLPNGAPKSLAEAFVQAVGK